MSLETITKPKKLKIALPERIGNNFYRLCVKFKSIDEETIPLDEYIKYLTPMAKALSSILTIMENGHETSPCDIKNIVIVKADGKKEIDLTFDRYRQCKLQPIHVMVREFAKGVVEIEPSVPTISHF